MGGARRLACGAGTVFRHRPTDAGGGDLSIAGAQRGHDARRCRRTRGARRPSPHRDRGVPRPRRCRHGRPLLRWRRTGTRRLHPLRPVHARLPAQRQELPAEELPIPRRGPRRPDTRRTHRHRHPPAGDSPDGSAGYLVTSVKTGRRLRRQTRTQLAGGVVLAGGALGTTRLLHTMRDSGAMPRLSARIGDHVRTNSEAIVAATARRRDADLTADIAITRSVHPDEHTHFTNNTYGAGGDLLGVIFGPLTGGRHRAWQFLWGTPRQSAPLAEPAAAARVVAKDGHLHRHAERRLVAAAASGALGQPTGHRAGGRTGSEQLPTHRQCGGRGGRARHRRLPAVLDVGVPARRTDDRAHPGRGRDRLDGTRGRRGPLPPRVRVSQPADHRRVHDARQRGCEPLLTITAMAEEALSHVPNAPPTRHTTQPSGATA